MRDKYKFLLFYLFLFIISFLSLYLKNSAIAQTIDEISTDETIQLLDTTQESPDITQEPPDTTQEPPDTTQEPPDITQEPPDTTQEPPDTTQEPPDTTQEPSNTTQEVPITTPSPIDQPLDIFTKGRPCPCVNLFDITISKSKTSKKIRFESKKPGTPTTWVPTKPSDKEAFDLINGELKEIDKKGTCYGPTIYQGWSSDRKKYGLQIQQLLLEKPPPMDKILEIVEKYIKPLRYQNCAEKSFRMMAIAHKLGLKWRLCYCDGHMFTYIKIGEQWYLSDGGTLQPVDKPAKPGNGDPQEGRKIAGCFDENGVVNK